MHVRLAVLRFLLPPVTPRGVAACAQRSWTHLLAAQIPVAILSGLIVLWFVKVAWLPVVRQGIAALPDRGEISAGSLHWEGPKRVTLASGHFLAIAVNVEDGEWLGSPAHLRIELGSTRVRACSLLGCISVRYPQGWRIALNRPELEPWWGARESFICLGMTGAVAIGVWLSWQVLSLLYCLPAWLMAAMCGRPLSLREAWRLAGAAVLPGAGVMLLTITLYGMGALDVVRLLFGMGLHFVCGWLFLVASLGFLPQGAAKASSQGNPFQPRSKTSGRNPFGSDENRSC